jgi:hypothetical protein
VSRRNVLVSENRNDSLEIRHDVLLLSHYVDGANCRQGRATGGLLLPVTDLTK